jgi:uroporphyrinogen-III synthase
MRLIVTRPQPQAAAWAARLNAAGCDAQALPLLRIVSVPERSAVQQVWRALPEFDLVAFVSPNAVAHFFGARPPEVRWPASLLAAAPGPGSADSLAAVGVGRVVQPAADSVQFDSEALWQQLSRHDWAGRRTLIVRGEGGRNWLADTLRGAGATVEFVQAYCRAAPEPDGAQLQLLLHALALPAEHLWLFSSSEGIDQLDRLAPGADWSASRALASHPRIAHRARLLGCAEVTETAPVFEAVLTAARRLQRR